MGLLEFFFGRRQPTAGIAKERLQIVLAHERAGRDAPDFMPALQRDILVVVGKYVAIKEDLVRVKIGRHADASTLEINIELDPTAVAKAPPREPPKPANAAPAPKIASPRTKSVGKRR
jgi:cell division topological specificity factor